jgi:aryl carrier-like protein
MTYEEWTTAVAPKVDGAWNLHNAFLDNPLDFFVMTSSLVTLVDQPGQCNYSGANTFLESFCQYRHTLGLAASVLSICPVDGVGFVAENPAARKKLKSQGLYFLAETEFLDYIELAILNSHQPTDDAGISADPSIPWKNSNHLIMGLRSEVHLDDVNNNTSWRRDRRMGTYHNVKNTNIDASANFNALKNFLSRAADEPEILGEKPSAEYLAHEIGQKVFNFMLKPEDVNIALSLTQIGLDSLMAIELRRWWKHAFGLDISVMEIMASGTLEELGKMAAERVRKKLTGDGMKSKRT